LAEDVQGSAKTGELASALLEGGYRSQADRFPNLVSAALSGMKIKGEVETSEDDGYRLTKQGRQTWESIRHSSKFRHAISNELLLLGMQ
jgi:Mn-dependent DtxR family transcriptional regulator